MWISNAERTLESQPTLVFAQMQLLRLISNARNDWSAPTSSTPTQLLGNLVEAATLKALRIKPPAGPALIRYAFGSVSTYSVAISIRTGSYLSHASAMVLHNLTEQVPAVIYVNKEQSDKPSGGNLSQEGIDRAFSRPPRRSNYIWTYEQHKILLVSGKQTGRLGVIPFVVAASERVDVTSLERTLIDLVVRPHYAGGVLNVLEAFKAARERVSPPQLVGVLRQLGYVYPYHQALGVYLEAAGYPDFLRQELLSMGTKFDFYLTYDMRERSYSPTWRTFIPAGFPAGGQAH